MCFSGCYYENWEGVCTLRYGDPVPEDAHCAEENLMEHDVRRQYEWDKAEYEWDNRRNKAY